MAQPLKLRRNLIFQHFQMSKWDNLPNELLCQIIGSLRHPAGNQWKSVNKQRYEAYLSKEYNYMCITPDERNVKLDYMLCSQFKPGLRVREVWLDLSSMPDDFPYTSITLYTMMTFCPNVKKVHFESTIKEHWVQFLRLLQSNNGWNELNYLEIPSHLSGVYIIPVYFDVAFYFKDTIRKLGLSHKIMDIEHCNKMKEFTALTELMIDQEIFLNLDVRKKIFKNSPLVTKLTIDVLSDMYDDWQLDTSDSSTFSRVKELEIVYYRKSCSIIELLNYVPKFKNLQSLHVNES